MNKSLAAALVVAPSFASGAEIELSSRIERVTVYPDGAVVTRIGRTAIEPGASQIMLRGLPEAVDPASIQVEGEADGRLTIGAVDVRTAPGEARPVLDAVLEAKLKALRGEREGTAGRINATEAKRASIERFGQTGPDKLGPGGHALPVGEWQAVWDAVGTALVAVADELRLQRNRLADLDAEIAALERARPQASRPGAPKRDVAIAVEAGGRLDAALTVSYRVAGASWQPSYEARLTTGSAADKPALELLRRAELRQRTGEDWRGVALTVSTVRILQGTRAPELPPLQIGFLELPVAYEARPTARMAAPAAPSAAGSARTDAAAGAQREKAEQEVAQLESGAFQASFLVPGRVDVPPDGSSRAVLLSQRRVEPALVIRATPELDQTAYLEATFGHEEDAPLLAGPVALHRDGAFIGRGRLGLTPPGERVELGFGADDRIKVTRAPVRRRENEPSWFGQTKQDQREFRTLVKSLHTRPMKVIVSERLPFSENATITVEMLPATTAPTEKQVGDKRGVMAWTLDLQPGEQKEIRVAYRLKWPGERDVVFTPRPITPAGPRPSP